MIGFGENVGSGFPKIIAAWKETNWGEPQLLNKLDVDEVELVLPVPSTKATSVNATVNAPVNAPANATVKLSKTQIAIVKAIINNNHVTYDDLKTILGVDRSTITRNIAVLKEKGVIRRVGEDKNGYWEVLLDINIVDKWALFGGANVVHCANRKIRKILNVSFLRILLSDPVGIEYPCRLAPAILQNLKRLQRI